MPSLPPPSTVVAELQGHPHARAMRAAVRRHALDAARARNASLVTAGLRGASAEPVLAELAGIERAELDTTLGNVAEVLERGPGSPAERALLGALLAASLADEPAPAPEVAADLVWLDTYAAGTTLEWLDPVLAERADPLWECVAGLTHAANGAARPRAEALIAAAALGGSDSSVAQRLAGEASTKTADPAIASLLASPGAATAAAETALEGEVAPRPYGPVATALLAVTLVLFVLRAVRVVGRFTFGYRRPATLTLSSRGLSLGYRTELLGRVLRQGTTLVPLASLARITRETRYARTGMYVGLGALIVGTYLGMGLFVDGVRVPGGSPPLLGLAITLMALGLLVDYALTSLSDSARGRCRILVVPLKGRRLCIGGLDPARADRMLAAVAEQARRAAG